MSVSRLVCCAISMGGVCASALGQACPYGEPGADYCFQAREIPWVVGQHVLIVDPGNATGSEAMCGMVTGRTVWFQFTATSSEHVKISTCHPATSYDTVLEVWRGGEQSCDFMTDVGCSDDEIDARCNNGCSSWGSEVSFDAIQGERYHFAVGAYNDNAAGCSLCLGVIVTIGEPCGEPPVNLACRIAKELSGAPGIQQVAVDVQDALAIAEPAPTCGANVGNTVWFKVMPIVHGPMTFSTCGGSTFDTVVQAWSGSCPSHRPEDLLVNEGCVDDTNSPECLNDCDPQHARGSAVTVFAEKGRDYYFQVGSFDHNSSGCALCLGATLTIEDICETDTTAPLAEITSPGDLACVCSQVDIMGTANDPDGTWGRRLLEFKPIGDGSWQTIIAHDSPVINGVLGTWNTAGLSDGWYFLRLTSTNICDRSSTAVRLVRVDKTFSSLTLRSPANGNILGGQICADGTAWDECFQSYSVQWRATGGTFAPVDPAQPTYSASILYDPLATWPSSGRPDGNYEVKVTGQTICGSSASATANIVVDNTAPIAVITEPTSCSSLEGIVPIRGTVIDAHLAGWTLQYTGGDAHGWVTITAGTGGVSNSLLANWDVRALRPCAYALRLVATDSSVLNCNGALHNQTEYTVAEVVNWEDVFDADHDGDVDLADLRAFLLAFHGPNIP